ncbi:MAG: hypothetical protein ACKO8K_00350, partial [Candidatus Limnocylindrus sp.]
MSLRRTLNLTLVAVISLSIVVGACEGTPASPNASTPRTPLSVGLGYIPSVQFAPFYLAEQSGAYERAG